MKKVVRRIESVGVTVVGNQQCGRSLGNAPWQGLGG